MSKDIHPIIVSEFRFKRENSIEEEKMLECQQENVSAAAVE